MTNPGPDILSGRSPRFLCPLDKGSRLTLINKGINVSACHPWREAFRMTGPGSDVLSGRSPSPFFKLEKGLG